MKVPFVMDGDVSIAVNDVQYELILRSILAYNLSN